MIWPSRKRRGNTPIWTCTTTRDGRCHGVLAGLGVCLIGLSAWLPLSATAWWDGRDTYNAYFMPMSTWYRHILDDLARTYPDRIRDPVLIVRVGEQRLYRFERGLPMQHYPVSTSRFGVGNRDGSLRTPLGVHQVRRRIGDQAPPGTIFRGRRNTGEVARILNGPGERSPDDNITSRILWLDGLEEGVNRGDGIDSFQRFIYIHGTDEEGRIGRPASDGCVRMTNTDVIELFDRVPQGTLVVIVE